MKVKLRKTDHPTIDRNDPWAKDIFERERVGKMLADMILGLEQPFVIAVNGGWGSGKSVFLERLAAHLGGMAPRTHCIQVDAWKSDWHDDPLIALALATNDTMQSAGFQRAQDIGASLVGFAAAVAGPVAGLIAQAVSPGSGVSASMAAKAGADLIQRAADRAAARRGFEESLCDARDLLLRREEKGPIKGHVVIVIDELDRCRPDYAIRMLERIKHLYSLPGFVFVLATDNVNLRSAVKSVYGPDTDGERYLRKFFDFELHLRAPGSSQYIKALQMQFGVGDNHLGQEGQAARRALSRKSFDGRGIGARGVDWAEAIHEFEHQADRMSLSLRDQSQAFSILYAMMAVHVGDEGFLPAVAAYFACLRFGQERAFEIIKTKGFKGLKTVISATDQFGESGPYLENLHGYLTESIDEWHRKLSSALRHQDSTGTVARTVARLDGLSGPKTLLERLDDMIFMMAVPQDEYEDL